MKIPQHIAIIMDGNGRWAKEHNMPRNEGHRRGTKVLEEIIKYANQLGVRYLTVYAFSTENWRRPKEEVDGLMKLFKKYLDENIKKASKDDVRFNAIGDMDSKYIPQEIRDKIKKLEEITKDKQGLCFNMAFNYGGRDELIRACKKIISDVEKGDLKKEQLTESVFESYLDTKGQPDPDLMIRTSGEERTSNFLPWQLTYSEFYFTPCLWPDFTKKEFDRALEVYSKRQRRFGKSE
ncbi:di-trans,poly-cis-decaprenylcistransferase [Sporanaerobium hydrogeniformans]|uniref:Di-trans,poly-cis-decaprenylcistransferase n=1 Tax=Sporanaerobium hydrogeniformans TaxID=3072179 RepID=A0AC61DGF7_9FIRM|nr:di-trans,poly-cis-decaprenylcistransferase [Sporanaerobium hydrogeniformans]